MYVYCIAQSMSDRLMNVLFTTHADVTKECNEVLFSELQALLSKVY